MLNVLATLVGNDEQKSGKPQVDPLAEERMNTVSTAATDEVLLEQIVEIPFLVEVLPESDDMPLGITVSFDDDPSFLTIDDVRAPGLIAEWNASHDQESRVQIGQVITSVNGVSDAARDMLASIKGLRKGVPLQLLIQNSSERGAPEKEGSLERQRLIVNIDDGTPMEEVVRNNPLYVELRPREGMPLGLAVSLDDDPSYVSIDGISSPGLIAEWNNSQGEELTVCKGDRITRVNTCSGNARRMVDMLTSIQRVNRGAVLQLRIEPPCHQQRRKRRST